MKDDVTADPGGLRPLSVFGCGPAPRVPPKPPGSSSEGEVSFRSILTQGPALSTPPKPVFARPAVPPNWPPYWPAPTWPLPRHVTFPRAKVTPKTPLPTAAPKPVSTTMLPPPLPSTPTPKPTPRAARSAGAMPDPAPRQRTIFDLLGPPPSPSVPFLDPALPVAPPVDPSDDPSPATASTLPAPPPSDLSIVTADADLWAAFEPVYRVHFDVRLIVLQDGSWRWGQEVNAFHLVSDSWVRRHAASCPADPEDAADLVRAYQAVQRRGLRTTLCMLLGNNTAITGEADDRFQAAVAAWIAAYEGSRP